MIDGDDGTKRGGRRQFLLLRHGGSHGEVDHVLDFEKGEINVNHPWRVYTIQMITKTLHITFIYHDGSRLTRPTIDG